jgi:hypothetical protein
VVWWLIPLVATLAAWLYTRMAGVGAARAKPRPVPGSPEDQRELRRFGEALGRPMPGLPDA